MICPQCSERVPDWRTCDCDRFQAVHGFAECTQGGCEGCTDHCPRCGEYVPIADFDAHFDAHN